MPSRAKRAAAPQFMKDVRAERARNKKAVRAAEIAVWKQNGGGRPAASRLESRILSPEEYERAWGRPMPAELEEPGVDYDRYIASGAWVERRRAYYGRHRRRCAVCGRYGGVIHLHHLTYEHLGAEPDEDLIPLCTKHHNRFHFLCDRRRADMTIEDGLRIIGIMRRRVDIPVASG